jgi:hypothetical protein
VLPPLLPVPPPAGPPRKPCLPCHTEYQPNHVYLPENNPDCGGCDGECHPCRQWWVNASFLAGGSQDLGSLHRDIEFGVLGGAGYWFSPAKTFGLEVTVLDMHQPYREVSFDSIITSPITVWTTDASLRMQLWTHDRYRIDGLAGYRFAELHENLVIGVANGFATDHNTMNHINAAQIGLVGDYCYGAYFCELLLKLGLGRNSETLTINGVRTTDGVLAVVPEVGARVGYQLGEGVYGTLGYTFLYMNNVARPGKGDTDFFFHGFTIGVECRF